MRKYLGLYALLLVVVLAIAFVNPLREIMTADDGWAYALSVRHLVETGEYKLNDWASVNMPVQIYWVGHLAQLFGYSFILLRLSTLLLLFVAIVSFYYLLRDFGAGDVEAALLSAAVVSSPLIFFLSFTFQTDIQFIGWELLALLLYTRAMRNESYSLMAVASLAGAAAIGTRQFGAALVAGLCLTWLFLEQDRLRKIPFYGLGLALPVFMTIWQVAVGAHQPTFSQRLTLNGQLAYLRNWTGFAEEVFCRPAVSLQYLALFLLPLLPLGVALAHKQLKRREVLLNRRWCWLLIACATYIAAGIFFRFHYFQAKPMLVPYLDWILRDNGVLDRLFPLSNKVRLVITLLTYGFATILAWLFLDRYLFHSRTNVVSRWEWFILLCGVTAFGLQLLFVWFCDVYLIAFVPFTAFALSQIARTWPRWCKALTAILCLFALSISSSWTRVNLAHAEANWKAAEIAHAVQADSRDIAGNMTWSCYNGAFEDWIAEIAEPPAAPIYTGGNLIHPAFFAFLLQRYDRAHYVISSSHPQSNFQLLGTTTYRDKWLRPREIYVIKRM
jgi:4-amino-4-deoxy-L-arabinose transferase-like glycosyltransferase